MTARELKITKAGLDWLNDLEGGQATNVQIHKGIIDGWPPDEAAPSAQEVDAAVANWNAQRWVLGVPFKFNKRVMKWNLTNLGEAARLEM